MELYRDPWIDYRAILDSLKKKFLKKPNYSQALAQFENLILRFEDERCEKYVAMCYREMAKIYEIMGDWSAQYSRMLEAARRFMNAVRQGEECLNYSQDCYNIAIKLILGHNGIWLAGLHNVELATALSATGHSQLALKYFIRGSRLLEFEPRSHSAALKKLLKCQCFLEMYPDALSTVDELWTAHMKNTADPQFSSGKKVLELCEMTTILLHLLINSNDISPRHRLLLSMYDEANLMKFFDTDHADKREFIKKNINDLPWNNFPLNDSALCKERFICLFDFILSIRKGDVLAAKRGLSRLADFSDQIPLNLASALLSKMIYNGSL